MLHRTPSKPAAPLLHKCKMKTIEDLGPTKLYSLQVQLESKSGKLFQAKVRLARGVMGWRAYKLSSYRLKTDGGKDAHQVVVYFHAVMDDAFQSPEIWNKWLQAASRAGSLESYSNEQLLIIDSEQ